MKKSNKWEKLGKARKLLQLGETVTIRQLKQSFRDLAKKHHPDTAAPEREAKAVQMQELNAAYQLLLEHCENHAIPLERDENQEDAEDWWMNRFGDDPLWGKSKKKG